MILYRCFRYDSGAGGDRPGGPLCFPREHQGAGRHDNPDAFGCLYATGTPASGVAELLAPFAGRRLRGRHLEVRGLPLALATIELGPQARLIDLDEPRVLAREGLRPSLVATRAREITQPQALAVWRRHRHAAGIRWWSTFESLWANVTLFHRAARSLRVLDVRELALDDPAVAEAAELLGMRE